MSNNIKRIQELFVAALELPAQERETWLQTEVGDDQPLFDKVLDLLRHDEPTTDPLEKGLDQDWLGAAGLYQRADKSGLHVRCPHCHHPVELIDDIELSDVFCNSCGSSFSLLEIDETKSFSGEKSKSIAHFDLIERIGIGAFGSVYKAHDSELDRMVAIKVPRKGQLSNHEVEKFLREARTSAQLQHPNIVAVHEVGRDGDRIYIVSDLIEGVTLADWLTGPRPTPLEAAQLCIRITEALQYAHDQGVIHRDLKPSNIMLTQLNQPVLMDFGLAKREAAEITMTIEGQVLGTPAYMSPEQAKGDAHSVEGTTDIYAVGVILFELLTGERPFRGNTRMLLHQVMTEDAPSPHKYDSSIPKDLETICLKCLEKTPNRRYSTASELKEELQRFVDNKPILARPISRWEQGWRWCQRKPAIASLLCLLAAALVIGTGVSSYFAIDAHFQANRLKGALADVDEQRLLAEKNASRAVASEAETESLLYRSDMFLAGHAFNSRRFSRMKSLLDRHQPSEGKTDNRGFVWNCLWNIWLSASHEINLGHEVKNVAVSPDGKWLASIANESQVRLTDMDSMEPSGALTIPDIKAPVTCFAWSPDSRLIVTGHFFQDSHVRIWNVADRSIRKTIAEDGTTITAISFSPDQALIAWATRKRYLRILDLATDEIWTLPTRTQTEISDLSFSPNGRLLALVGLHERELRILDVFSRRIAHKMKIHGGIHPNAIFTAKGDLFLHRSKTELARVMINGPMQKTKLIELPNHRESGGVTAISCSHDGTQIAIGFWHGQVLVIDSKTGQTLAWHLGHVARVTSLCFSSDNFRLVSASMDHSVRIWDLRPTSKSSFTRRPPLLRANSLAVSPDGEKVAMIDASDLVVYDIKSRQNLLSIENPILGLSCVTWSEDGTRVAIGGAKGSARIVEVSSGKVLAIMDPKEGKDLFAISISKDGKQISTAGEGGRITIWDQDGKHLFDLDLRNSARVDDVIFLADSNRLISSSSDRLIRVWDLDSKSCIQTLRGHDLYNIQLRVLSERNRIVSSSWDRTVRIWDLDSGECLKTYPCARGGIFDLDISEDGRQVAVADSTGGTLLVDYDTGELLVEFRSETKTTNIAFALGGDALITAHQSGLVRIWPGQKPSQSPRSKASP